MKPAIYCGYTPFNELDLGISIEIGRYFSLVLLSFLWFYIGFALERR